MSTSTDAILFYGYCWDEEAKPWDIGKDVETGTSEDWEDRYALAKGLARPSSPFPTCTTSAKTGWKSVFSAADQPVLDEYHVYWNAKNAICKQSLCGVGWHCSDNCSMPYVVVKASEIVSARGDMTEVKSLSVDPSWNAALIDFCNTLGIDVSNKRPGWWLVSYWG